MPSQTNNFMIYASTIFGTFKLIETERYNTYKVDSMYLKSYGSEILHFCEGTSKIVRESIKVSKLFLRKNFSYDDPEIIILIKISTVPFILIQFSIRNIM